MEPATSGQTCRSCELNREKNDVPAVTEIDCGPAVGMVPMCFEHSFEYRRALVMVTAHKAGIQLEGEDVQCSPVTGELFIGGVQADEWLDREIYRTDIGESRYYHCEMLCGRLATRFGTDDIDASQWFLCGECKPNVRLVRPIDPPACGYSLAHKGSFDPVPAVSEINSGSAVGMVPACQACIDLKDRLKRS